MGLFLTVGRSFHFTDSGCLNVLRLTSGLEVGCLLSAFGGKVDIRQTGPGHPKHCLARLVTDYKAQASAIVAPMA